MKLKQVKEIEEQIKKMKSDISKRLDKLERFKKQVECEHPIKEREIVCDFPEYPHFLPSPTGLWKEKCTVCGKTLKNYYTQDEALKAEHEILKQKIKINETL